MKLDKLRLKLLVFFLMFFLFEDVFSQEIKKIRCNEQLNGILTNEKWVFGTKSTNCNLLVTYDLNNTKKIKVLENSTIFSFDIINLLPDKEKDSSFIWVNIFEAFCINNKGERCYLKLKKSEIYGHSNLIVLFEEQKIGVQFKCNEI